MKSGLNLKNAATSRENKKPSTTEAQRHRENQKRESRGVFAFSAFLCALSISVVDGWVFLLMWRTVK
jgi:hypothetical protein